ncbi:tetratricopeptide repeat protein [Streptosporangium sp. NPDC023963]|uniref:tetratricopeptide repeat protein n=1 Tax=Streptosporangium sp. NPDC023963 TaxID=3155608 RepID=UPI00341282A0
MSDAYISHAPRDAEWVRWLADRLRAEGLEVTYGEVLRSPGAIVVEVIEKAIRDASHGILVLSRASLTDPWVRQAYATLTRRSVEGGQRLIPVLIEDVELPEFAADRFHVDFSPVDGHDHDRRLDELVRALRGQVPEVVPGPVTRPGSGVRPEKPRLCVLRISPDEVTLQTSSYEGVPRPRTPEPGGQDPDETSRQARAAHSPTRTSVLNELVWRLGSARERGDHITRGPDGSGGVGALLAECGRELGRAYLTGAAGEALAAELAGAHALGATLRLGLEVAEELADLPWETLTVPGTTEPLALRPRVQLYRRVPAGTAPAIAISGPLRILVVMAAPEGPGSGAVLDLEAELAKILDSVERARRGGRGRPGAYVRILNQGTLAGIREALLQERFHVLHISCHAEPGALLLEDAAGRVDRVTTERFVRDGLPADRGVPLLVLSGCSTALDAPAGRTPDDLALGGLARGLTAAGVPGVLAMTASVTDPYATALAGSLYYELAVRDVPEVLPAFCDARRRLEEERRRLPAGSLGASLVEWATPALFLRGPSVSLYDPAGGFEKISTPAEPHLADGVPLRKVGEFVGRRSEIRTALTALRGEGPGVLLHGIGGVGKSSLAAELLRDLGSDAGLVVSAVSQTSPDQLLEEIGRTLLAAFTDERIRHLALSVREPQYEWVDRLQALGQLLVQVPVTLLLDNFEDNLAHDGTGWTVVNEELAKFLTAWIRLRGRHKLLITSRYPFPLPKRAERRLHAHHLGPLSLAEARKLMWRLPGLDALSVTDRQRAWADVGGHPRTLEYLDALLRGGQARFDDVRERLEDLLDWRGIPDPGVWLRSAGSGDLDAALAEAVTLAVDDTLLGELVGLLDDFSRAVLVGASVFRVAVDRVGVAWPVSTPAPEDPQRLQRLQRLDELLRRVRGRNPRAWLEDLGLSQEELEQARQDMAWSQLAPVVEPEGVEKALGVLAGLGLLAPGEDLVGAGGFDGERLFVVHRWTAGTLAGLGAVDGVRQAHAAAARFWQWRVQSRSQSAQQDVADMLEARFHHHAAGDLDDAVAVTDWVCVRLHTWGAWSWQEQLCREALSWVAAGSREQAAYLHQLGMIAQERGEFERALEYYRQSLTISEELGNRAGMASGYHHLGIIAQKRGKFERALEYYHQALTIDEELGDRVGMAAGYHQLGRIAEVRGEFERALEYYHQSLTINEELGNRAGMAAGYHHLGRIAEVRREFERALEYYHQSLTINEELGNRADMAAGYHHLGIIAQKRGEFERALEYYRQSLTIKEELGDRAGMVSGYHQFGVIAEERGEFERALEYYRQSLTISEELGDWAGMASTYGQIGALYTKTGRAAEAVAFTVRSLLICAELQTPEIRIDLHWLGRQREALGEAEFRRLLAEHLSPEGVDTVIGWLDQPDA